MEESLSDMLKEQEALQHEMQALEDAGRLTGRPWLDLIVEETGLTSEQVDRATTRLASRDAG